MLRVWYYHPRCVREARVASCTQRANIYHERGHFTVHRCTRASDGLISMMSSKDAPLFRYGSKGLIIVVTVWVLTD